MAAGHHALAAALALALTGAASSAFAQEALTPDAAPACEIDRPVRLAGLGYDSAQFHNAVAAYILEHGYGCATETVDGETIPLIEEVADGEVDVIMEVWTANPAAAWTEALEAGTVVAVGTNFPGATEGWFVPRYVVEGEGAPAPDLRAVTDLAAYKDLFADPEAPGMGRFYNCPEGQVCEEINTAKLAAYGLDGDFTNFRASSRALLAVVEAAVLQNEPVLFYHFGPSWLLGEYDFYQLEEPPFDAVVWADLTTNPNPTAATAYPSGDVIIGANADFAAAAPGIVAFLDAYETTNEEVSRALAYMHEIDGTPEDAAEWFLYGNGDVWAGWVPAEVAERVTAALGR